jgi:hypothetical protein
VINCGNFQLFGGHSGCQDDRDGGAAQETAIYVQRPACGNGGKCYAGDREDGTAGPSKGGGREQAARLTAGEIAWPTQLCWWPLWPPLCLLASRGIRGSLLRAINLLPSCKLRARSAWLCAVQLARLQLAPAPRSCCTGQRRARSTCAMRTITSIRPTPPVFKTLRMTASCGAVLSACRRQYENERRRTRG